MKNIKNTVRIIGGKWRSRKLEFADIDDLRPTHDRVRETLFNWLEPVIDGAVCLDLFAGSGVLGFEALSRGASKIVFVDSSAAVEQALNQNSEMLSIQDQLTIVKEQFPSEHIMNRLQGIQFDIVFLDPPYRKGLLQPCLEWLGANSFLKDEAKVYIEYEKGLQLALPKGFELIKHKETQTLCYGLMGWFNTEG